MRYRMKLIEFLIENSRCNSKENFNAVESYNPKIDSSLCCNPIFIMTKMLPKVMIPKLIQQYPAVAFPIFVLQFNIPNNKDKIYLVF